MTTDDDVVDELDATYARLADQAAVYVDEMRQAASWSDPGMAAQILREADAFERQVSDDLRARRTKLALLDVTERS